MVSVAVPLLVMVTVSPALVVATFWLPKLMGLGAMESEGTSGEPPVPVRLSVVLAVPAVIVRMALSAVIVAGVKVNLTVQEAPAAIVPPFAHVPVPALAKSAAFGPVSVK